MKTLIIVATAALLSGGTAIASAQDASNTSQKELLKKPNANSAKQDAAGQTQQSGAAEDATDLAPGQQQKSGATIAEEATPGKLKKQDGATSEQPGGADKSQQMNAEEKAVPNPDPKPDQATDETKPSSETTASIDISAEQKAKLRDVLVETRSEPVDIDIEVNVGVAVPRTVTLKTLPARVVEIVPAYRGYEYFVLADGRIVIVDPGTLKVVYVLIV